MLLSLLAAASLIQQRPDTLKLDAGVRTPAYATDGRLAVSLRGDLWIVPARTGASTGPMVRVTSGPGWDRDPAWTGDGSALVFSSDRAGKDDLWRVVISGAGAGEPERLTSSPDPATEPSVAPNGVIAYVRGRGAAADLWLRKPDGSEERLTTEAGGEREPSYSRDGASIAYIAERDGARTLRVRTGDREVTLHADRPAERPAWSADGRIAFTSSGRTAGVWVTSANGSYIVLASQRRSHAAWSPDGRTLALAEPPAADGGYNGDPDRLGDRAAGDIFRGAEGRLRIVRAPDPPDTAAEEIALDASLPRSVLNADAIDRVFRRVARLYFPDSTAATSVRWREARERHRARAVAAKDEAELEDVIHALIRERPPLREEASGRAAVSSAHALATAAGTEILQAGGNVVDAAVAVSFALGVVEPDASGVGGYGEMLIHMKGMTDPVAIEFMTRLPEAVNHAPERSTTTPAHNATLANVPGTVAGMELAWKRFGSGRVSWARIIEPAIRLAENGHAISDGFATTLAREYASFARYESSRKLFFKDGRPLETGDTLRNPDLAWTLREIAKGGAEAFYRGEPARRLVNDLRSHGNPISMLDMNVYFAAERRPVRTTYRGHAVYSGPPPVSGGASLAGKLNLLELTEPGRSMTDDPVTLHGMIEAWRYQPSSGNRIADPDLFPTDVTPFESKDTARARWRCFSADKAGANGALARPDCGRTADVPGNTQTEAAGTEPIEVTDEDCAVRPPEQQRGCRSTGTTAFAVADADGNAVSVTQTLGTWGGNFYVTPGLGFLYNDKFNSYRGSDRIPFARNSTVIAPTIVYDGNGSNKRPLLALGAAGNAWITSAVYAMVVGVLDHDLSPQQALELPRMLPGGSGAIQIEDGFAPAALRKLQEMGHTFRTISLKGELRQGYGAAVLIRNGKATAGADPRRAGAAGAVK